MVKWLAGAVIGIAILVAAILTAIFFWLSTPEDPPERSPVADHAGYRLDQKVGEYQLPSGDRGLLTFSARGGLYLFRLKGRRFTGDDYLGHFSPENATDFLWRGRDGSFERRVTFADSPGGRAISFSWTDAGKHTNVAARIADPPVRLGELDFSSDVRLSGTVFLPDSPGPHPGAVMIHGSGQSNRDNLWYLHIAHHLAANGIAVLLPDKRGTGKSGGEWRTALFADFANDALAGVEAIAALPGVAPDKVGLLGISQGGSWVAPLAASWSNNVRFIVSVSGASVTPNEQLRHETAQTLHEAGVPAWLDPVLVPYAAAIPKRRRSEWWTGNGDFDPIPYWRQSDQPALVLYGAEDEQDNVPVAESVARFRALERPRLTVRVFDDTGHGFLAQDPPRLRDDFLTLLTRWIREHAADR